jgi:hypothetical protein
VGDKLARQIGIGQGILRGLNGFGWDLLGEGNPKKWIGIGGKFLIKIIAKMAI